MTTESSSSSAIQTTTSDPLLQAPNALETDSADKTSTNAFSSKYKILSEIGHGAQGRIYTAQRLSDGKIVVVKQLNINSIKTWKEYELFHREAKVLETLNIPGVAKFYEGIECLDDDPPCSYIVQEYIDGVSLQQLIKNAHRFSVENVYEILIQTLQILDRLHHHIPPIIHRDIKPSNLMISRDQDETFKVTLIDFGAVANPQIQGGGSTVAGTLGYMPPEQLTGKPVPASDIYALGALAVQLFSGKSPADLPVKDFRLIFEPEMENRPHQLVTLLRQMLEPNPENRLSNIPEIIKQFMAFKAGDFEHAHVKTSTGKKKYNEEYDEKLASVSSLCEPGNIDLWQQLPDSENRQVPVIFDKILDKKRKLISVQESNSKKNEIPEEIKILLGCLAFLAISVGLLTSAIVFHINIFLTVIVAFFLGLFAFAKITKSNPPPCTVLENTQNIKDAIQLIGNSRKTIATIIKISYVPVPSKRVKKRAKSEQSVSHVVNGMPRFKILYKFNPPDDVRSEDIIHEYYTHVERQGHYKVGDQIPILYHIQELEHDLSDVLKASGKGTSKENGINPGDEVSSMPFPLPLSDFDDDADNIIVARSKGINQ